MNKDNPTRGGKGHRQISGGLADAWEPLTMVFYLARLTVVKRVKRLQSSGEIKEYESYRVRVPHDVIRKLNLKPYDMVIVGVAKPKDYYLALFSGLTHPSEFAPSQLAELCYLGLIEGSMCRRYRVFTVIASEEQLEMLGIKPYSLVWFDELASRLQPRH